MSHHFNTFFEKNKFRVIKGDITQIEPAAIVNVANTFLLGGGVVLFTW